VFGKTKNIGDGPRSALGQNESFPGANGMSASPRKADMGDALGHGSEGPKAAVSSCSEEQSYSITSSALARSEGGTAMPSALAVLRLITSSIFVGRTTGKSAGFSPLRIRPV
jgi:hypothetical protein